MGKLKDFMPSLDMVIASFLGGIVLSLLELANMCKNHENIADLYFYIGMFIAGLLGIVGLIVSRSKDLGGAVTAGIAAPQVLAGIAKTGAVVQTVFFNTVTPIIYAQPLEFVLSKDSVEITIVTESSVPLEVRQMHQDGGYFLKDTLMIRLPDNETLIFSGIEVEPVRVEPTVIKKGATIQLKVIDEKAHIGSGLLRGMFAQQIGRPKKEKKHLELKIITYEND